MRALHACTTMSTRRAAPGRMRATPRRESKPSAFGEGSYTSSSHLCYWNHQRDCVLALNARCALHKQHFCRCSNLASRASRRKPSARTSPAQAEINMLQCRLAARYRTFSYEKWVMTLLSAQICQHQGCHFRMQRTVTSASWNTVFQQSGAIHSLSHTRLQVYTHVASLHGRHVHLRS